MHDNRSTHPTRWPVILLALTTLTVLLVVAYPVMQTGGALIRAVLVALVGTVTG